ncbi:MAG: glycogen debranching enzyme N-terminal domain-containing protein [Proteobacteria bacterium]|nr:glycogen debranching enzyme N-terminal domain-containing protein [Pseudomonadota bacterium]MBU1584626.1 glycogen debranching enzyme N-terminal domain-containing protein [Pseudomonadota bacterium]
MKPQVTQSPPPGNFRVMYCGDCATFTLMLSSQIKGKAFVRTNLGAAAISRQEIILRVEKNEIKLDEAWYDIEMKKDSQGIYKIVLPLHQTGFFQAKCFFMPENSSIPIWQAGGNCTINVEPAGTCCANIIYNAFVRQFGRSKSGATKENELSTLIETLDAKGYTVIPESGKFRDLKKEVDFIFSTLGCRALHLLPIHPTPTTYARMGRFGSPYAALNFTDVDPALAEFDPSATPLEQFMELVDAVHFHNGCLFMDIAINHTGWAAAIHETNPEWLVRKEDGEIEAPGAWGVVWADLTKLDYSNTSLWKYMADVFLLWCHRGVDGFRCDAGYMIPVEAWEYMVAKVRQEYPDTLFFLEGLGGPIKTTREILTRANFNWAYSELFQNYTKEQLSHYLPLAWDISDHCGHLIHFAETHDNNRLASVSEQFAKMRTALCALFSVCGGFGFANGVEWFACEKINVHESAGLNWGNQKNQVDHISRLTRILKTHPAFFDQTRLKLIEQKTSQCLILLRHNLEYDKRLLILVNLDCDKSCDVTWKQTDINMANTLWHDLITGAQIKTTLSQDLFLLRLTPGQVLALTPNPEDMDFFRQDPQMERQAPQRVLLQKLKAKVLSIHTDLTGFGDISVMAVGQEALKLAADPIEYIRSLNRNSKESRVIAFDIEKDLKRQVMVPPGFFLLIWCPNGFRAELLDESKFEKISLGYEEGIPTRDKNRFFALFLPKTIKKQHKEITLSLRIFEPGRTWVKTASLLYLVPFDTLYMRSSFTRKEIVNTPFLKLLATTKKGGMMRASASWGNLYSRYDAFLGANLDTTMPENRWMVLSRCRIWAIFQGYSRELSLDCLETFWFSYDNGGKWLFHVPTSEGKYYALEIYLSIDRDENRVSLSILRENSRESNTRFLEDDRPVTLIIRPDIEDRSFHETVKAFQGPETQWPAAVETFDRGFFFPLSRGKTLCVALSQGTFIHEPEWHYMIHRPMEAQRGLDPESDLFSPGYFTIACLGGQTAHLEAAVIENHHRKTKPTVLMKTAPSFKNGLPLFESIYKAMDAFLVDRGADKSVIAGYPWFLDWGRDSLIFCRSLIELERFSEAKAILRLFGRFEKDGTLPNMICGTDAGNIETSDAPLWFFACCKDLIQKTKKTDFLEEDLNGRTVKTVLISMAHSMINGTKTGVKADPLTLLLYSPAHFTWMDTNFPAGSPRQGYPVEIQALWYNALILLSSIDPSGKWQEKSKTVQDAVVDLFWQESLGYFSDCLHCDGPVGAQNAMADDALRPNQLLLFTLDVIKNKNMAQKSVERCQELLVPGGIRSLADKKVEYPLTILYNNQLLKDPHAPYSGTYKGDEDTLRKPAYHNGTAWTWQFPLFCEAWAALFGKNSYPNCLAWLGSVIRLMRTGAAGYIPEILDGDFPHAPRGCDAQAWGISEVARVVHKLSR